MKLTTVPRIPIAGEITWDGTAPSQPSTSEIQLSLEPLRRPFWKGEIESLNQKASIPGQFSFSAVLMEEHTLHISGVPKDSYVKEAMYAGMDVLHDSLLPGIRGDSTVRIVLGRDGGTIQAKTVDKDGNAIPDTCILIMPVEASSTAVLAGSMIRGSTDQNGNYSSPLLRPGKYLAIATESRVDFSIDRMQKLWMARTKAQEIELAPNGSASVTLERIAID